MKSSPRSFSRRISILTPSLAGQGAERVALTTAIGLTERGHEIDVLLEKLIYHYPDDVPSGMRIFSLSCRYADARTRTNLEHMPIILRPLVSGPPPWRIRYPHIGIAHRLRPGQLQLLLSTRLPRWAAGVAAYLDREQPDALLAVNTLSATAAALALQLTEHPVRVVAALHNVLRTRRTLYRASQSYPYADAVVGVSHGVTTEFGKIPGLESKRIHTIYNPVTLTSIAEKACEPVNHSWLDNPDSPVILAAGKLNKGKDFSTLLTAFARLLIQRPARLIILGQGRLRSGLLSLARRLRIAGHVDFPGFVENPYAFFAKADLFVLSSRYEAFSMVLIEAMACGCPVVSTDCDYGPREILDEGKYGELVPVGDPETLSAAMNRALNGIPQRDALRKRASFFNVMNAIEQYEKLLLGERRGAMP